MSMTTTTKPRARRWQALALAALVLASGSVATPLAANAATVSTVLGSTYCRGLYDPPACSLTVSVKKSVSFTVSSSYPRGEHRYKVRAGGRVVCSGKLVPNHGIHKCSLGAHFTGRVRITVQAIPGTPLVLGAWR